MGLPRCRFRRSQRLTRKSEFAAMYEHGSRRTVGPLLIHVLQNQRGYSRLGLSVPKRVGNAVQRNRIKRRCREAFRLSQHELPTGIDILLTVRPHELQTTNQYRVHLLEGVGK